MKKTIRWLGVLAIASVPVFTSWACSGEQGTENTSSSEGALKGSQKTGSTAPVIPTNETAATFDTKAVGSIAIVLNNDEVTQSQLAVNRTQNKDVKTYANNMVTERQQALKTLESISGFDDNPQETLNVDSAEKDRTAGEFARTDAFTTNDLQNMNAQNFDFTYMTAEINNQAKLLSIIDRSLLPSLKEEATSGDAQDAAAPVAGANKQLQTELTQLRGQVAADLVNALNLQKVIRETEPPGGRTDAGVDSGADSGQPDAAQDAAADAQADTGADAATDAGADTGTPDTGTPDTGTPDTGTPDTGTPDTGTPDTGTPDTGAMDSGGG